VIREVAAQEIGDEVAGGRKAGTNGFASDSAEGLAALVTTRRSAYTRRNVSHRIAIGGYVFASPDGSLPELNMARHSAGHSEGRPHRTRA